MQNMEKWLQIDGKFWDVIVVNIKESGNILYSANTGRTTSVGARMTLDPLGTFIGHTITVKRHGDNLKAYDDLCEYVRKPRYDGMKVKAVDGQTTLDYEAYVSTYEREVQRIDDQNQKVYWKEMSINLVPMEAQILPL